MSAQLCFPGMYRSDRAGWTPRPHTLASIKSYLQGFQAHGRAIYARRRHIALKLGIGVRTLSRYLAHLAEVGWIRTIQRTARTAIRAILEPVSKAAGASAGTSKEVIPESRIQTHQPEYHAVVFLQPVRKRPSPESEPPMQLTNEYGRRGMNPAWLRWRDLFFVRGATA